MFIPSAGTDAWVEKHKTEKIGVGALAFRGGHISVTWVTEGFLPVAKGLNGRAWPGQHRHRLTRVRSLPRAVLMWPLTITGCGNYRGTKRAWLGHRLSAPSPRSSISRGVRCPGSCAVGQHRSGDHASPAGTRPRPPCTGQPAPAHPTWLPLLPQRFGRLGWKKDVSINAHVSVLFRKRENKNFQSAWNWHCSVCRWYCSISENYLLWLQSTRSFYHFLIYCTRFPFSLQRNKKQMT